MSEPRVSVVVPTLNGLRFLTECLAALRAQTFSDFETIVVDNGSSDGSLQHLRSHHPEVQVVELGENRGFAGAMNAGISAARSGLVAFLNNDAAPRPDWLAELVACLERHPRAAAATAKLLLAADPTRLDGAGDGLTRSFLPFVRGHGERDEGQFDAEVQVFGASGTASLWRSAALRDAGGFDERFFAYYEDVDLSFRARLLGYEIWYAPRAVALHARGGTAGRHVDFLLFHPVKNRWFMLVKDVPTRVLARRLPRVVVGELFFWGRAGRRRAPRAVARAYREVARNWSGLRGDRRAVQRRRRLAARDVERLLGRR